MSDFCINPVYDGAGGSCYAGVGGTGEKWPKAGK